jgi:hypothetical protein
VSRLNLGYTMDDGLKNSLRHLYDSGWARGYSAAQTDRAGFVAAIAATSFTLGALVALWMTGWL